MSDPNEPDTGHDEELGSLSVEDDPDGTVDPADLAGTADDADADSEGELRPSYSEQDLED